MEGLLLAELPALRGFLRKLVGGRAGLDAEDLLQETMARALKYQDSYDPDRPLGAWLNGIGFRVFLDARKHVGRGPRPLAGPAVELPAPEPPERPEDLGPLLAELADEERALLVAFHLRGRPLQDLAAEAGVPLGTLKSRLHRARRRLAAAADPEAWR